MHSPTELCIVSHIIVAGGGFHGLPELGPHGSLQYKAMVTCCDLWTQHCIGLSHCLPIGPGLTPLNVLYNTYSRWQLMRGLCIWQQCRFACDCEVYCIGPTSWMCYLGSKFTLLLRFCESTQMRNYDITYMEQLIRLCSFRRNGY